VNRIKPAAFSVGNRVDDPLQNVGSSSPVVVCKNTVMLLPQHCWGTYGCEEGGGSGEGLSLG